MADRPVGCAAIYNDFKKLEKGADRNILQFNKGKCKVLHWRRNNPRYHYIHWGLPSWKVAWLKTPQYHEPALSPCSKEGWWNSWKLLDHTWSPVPRPGLTSIREPWAYWRESSDGSLSWWRRLHLNTWKHFFAVRGTVCWHRLHREAVKSPLLGTFHSHLESLL